MACRPQSLLGAALAGVLALACETPPPDPSPAFPPEASDQWLEMRDCRHSHEHELRHIRVFANELAEAPYAALSATVPYPEGAVLLKAEYDDAACTQLLGFTAMRKRGSGYAPEHGDWQWQDLTVTREVVADGVLATCITCHADHCAPPTGYDLTCAEEL